MTDDSRDTGLPDDLALEVIGRLLGVRKPITNTKIIEAIINQGYVIDDLEDQLRTANELARTWSLKFHEVTEKSSK